MKKLLVLSFVWLFVSILHAQNSCFTRTFYQTNYAWNTSGSAVSAVLLGDFIYVYDRSARIIRKIRISPKEDMAYGKDVIHLYNALFDGYSITADEAGNLCFTAGSQGITNSLNLYFYTDNISKKHINFPIQPAFGRINYLTGIGDFSNHSSGGFLAGATINVHDKITIWKFKNYDCNLADNPLILSDMRDGNYALASTIAWIDLDNFIVFGNNIEPYRVNISDPYSVKLGNLKAGAGGGAVFQVQGLTYIAFPSYQSFVFPDAGKKGKIDIYNITNPAYPQYVTSTDRVGEKANTTDYVAVTASVNQQKVKLYVWAPNNGLAVYEAEATARVSFDGNPKFVNARSSEVSLSQIEEGTQLFYTTDGSVPTTSSNLYTAPIEIPTGNTLVRVLSVKQGKLPSLSEQMFVVSPVSETINQKWILTDLLLCRGGLAIDEHFIYKKTSTPPGFLPCNFEDGLPATHAPSYQMPTDFQPDDVGDIAVCSEFVYLSSFSQSSTAQNHTLRIVRYPKVGGQGEIILSRNLSSEEFSGKSTYGNGLGVYRNPSNQQGYLIKHQTSTNRILLWILDSNADIVGGKYTDPQLIDIQLIGNNQQPIRDQFSRISIIDENHFWLSGHYTNDVYSPYHATPIYCTLIKDETDNYTIIGERMLPRSDLNPAVGGATEFTLNGNRYGIFAANNHSSEKVWSNTPKHYSIIQKYNKGDGATPTGPVIATFPLNGFGTHKDDAHFVESVVKVEDDKVRIYSMGGNNGSACYEFKQAKLEDMQTEYQYGSYDKSLKLSDLTSSILIDKTVYYTRNKQLEGNLITPNYASPICDEHSVFQFDEGVHQMQFLVDKEASLPCTHEVLVNVGPLKWKGNQTGWWNDEGAWTINQRLAKTPTKNDVVKLEKLSDNQSYPIVNIADAQIHRLELAEGARITIGEGNTLTIQQDVDNRGRIEIEPASLLHVKANLHNKQQEQGLLIKTCSSKPNGSLIFHNTEENKVCAQVQMYSKAYWQYNADMQKNEYHWQYIGIPFCNYSDLAMTFSGAYIRRYNEAGWGTSQVDREKRLWVQLQNDDTMEAVAGYEIVQQQPRLYTFSGELFHADIHKTLSVTPSKESIQGQYSGQHILSNPYTAAISVDAIQFGEGLEKTVYLFNTGSLEEWKNAGESGSSLGISAGQYLPIPVHTAGYGDIPAEIPSMQGFLVRTTKGRTEDVEFHIPYAAVQKNTAMQRTKSQEKAWLRIDLEGEQSGRDVAWIICHTESTTGFDNGWDGHKLISNNTVPLLYIQHQSHKYQISTQPDLHCTDLIFHPVEGVSVYTLSFQLSAAIMSLYNTIYLEDRVTGEMMTITEDRFTYRFTHHTTLPTARFRLLTSLHDRDGPRDNCEVYITSFNQHFYIENLGDEDAYIELYNAMGQLLNTYNCKKGEEKSITHQLQTGAYLLKVKAKGEKTIKVVV